MMRRYARTFRVAVIVTAIGLGFTNPFHLTGIAAHGEECGDEGPAQKCVDCGCHLGHGSSCTAKHGALCKSDDTCALHEGEDCYFEDMDA